jgi:SAM-dependent methyltransferase
MLPLSARSYQRTGRTLLRAVGSPVRPGRSGAHRGDSDATRGTEDLSETARLSTSERINTEFWSSTDQIAPYETRVLLPVEVVVLARFHEAVSGRVLELGCGAGRLLGYLATLSREAHGIDISEAMVHKCNSLHPTARAQVGDIATLDGVPDLTFDAVFAINNVLDLFDDVRRRQVLARLRDRIDPQGLLIFSSHNLASREGDALAAGREPTSRRARALLSMLGNRTPSEIARLARRAPARVRNRRRLAPLQYTTPTHAVINDHAHDYSMLLYYIDRHSQEQQLAEAGYELLECLDVDGRPVHRNMVSRDPWLHYVATPK